MSACCIKCFSLFSAVQRDRGRCSLRDRKHAGTGILEKKHVGTEIQSICPHVDCGIHVLAVLALSTSEKTKSMQCTSIPARFPSPSRKRARTSSSFAKSTTVVLLLDLELKIRCEVDMSACCIRCACCIRKHVGTGIPEKERTYVELLVVAHAASLVAQHALDQQHRGGGLVARHELVFRHGVDCVAQIGNGFGVTIVVNEHTRLEDVDARRKFEYVLKNRSYQNYSDLQYRCNKL